MIDIKKLLSGPHITLRFIGPFGFHNICGYGHCKDTSCRNCPHTEYHIYFRKIKRDYLLPNWIQKILRKRWD